MKRRQFMMTMAGTAALAGLATWRGTGKPPCQRAGKRITGSGWALGAQVRLTVVHPDQRIGEAAIEAAFEELNEVENVLSLYRPASAICQLNRDCFLKSPHPWLRQVLGDALILCAATEGAFDVTIQPLYEVYAANKPGRPEAADLETARRKVDWRRVELREGEIRLRGEGTRLSLNGIAQGFAADRVAGVLLSHGITTALIDTGELGSLGGPDRQESWRVGIRHPRVADTLLGTTALGGRCLATSGDYETRFGDGYDRHHLFDPRTGQSANGLSSVSVIAGSAMEADGLSTALFVLGLEKGRDFLKTRPDVAALFVTKTGKVIPHGEFPLTRPSAGA